MKYPLLTHLLWRAAPFLMLVSAAPAATPQLQHDVEAIVQEYLLQHPEVVMQALQKFQANQKAAQDRSAADAIQTRKSELLADATSPAAGASAGSPTIVEFFDYRCGYCKRASAALLKLASERKARIVFKELPILGAESVALTKASLAANRQGAELYLKFHHALMTASDLSPANVEQLAAQTGLDLAKWRADKESPEVTAEIERNGRLAAALGVEATPTFIIGNQKIPGAIDEVTLNGLLGQMRASPTALTARK